MTPPLQARSRRNKGEGHTIPPYQCFFFTFENTLDFWQKHSNFFFALRAKNTRNVCLRSIVFLKTIWRFHLDDENNLTYVGSRAQRENFQYFACAFEISSLSDALRIHHWTAGPPAYFRKFRQPPPPPKKSPIFKKNPRLGNSPTRQLKKKSGPDRKIETLDPEPSRSRHAARYPVWNPSQSTDPRWVSLTDEVGCLADFGAI